MNRHLGKWFEEQVCKKLSELGYKGKPNIQQVGKKSNEIRIPQKDIGEIDYIGYSEKEKILIVVECKIVKEDFDPIYFRDSIKEFTIGKKSYASKFRNKIKWVSENIEQLKYALESDDFFDNKIDIQEIKKVMITFAPSYASYFIPDFPCVSLVEFARDYAIKNCYLLILFRNQT